MNPAEIDSKILNRQRIQRSIQIFKTTLNQEIHNILSKKINRPHLKLLGDKSFLSHYQQPKYHTIVKNNQFHSESLIRISKTSIEQYSSQLKKYLNLSCMEHCGVIIQPYSQYKTLIEKQKQWKIDIIKMQSEIKSQDTWFTQQQKKYTQNAMKQAKKSIQNEFYPFLVQWNHKLFSENSCRIVIFCNPQQQKNKNYYIYNSQLNHQPNYQNQKAIFKELIFDKTSKQINYLAQILRIHLVLQSNEKLLNKIRYNFKGKIHEIIMNRYEQMIRNKQIKNQQLLNNQHITQSFLTYQKNNFIKLIDQWKSKTEYYRTKSKDLYIEVSQILITKDTVPQSVQLYINHGSKIQYKYNGLKKNYLSYIINRKIEQHAFVKVNIKSQDKFLMKIQFQVRMIFGDTEKMTANDQYIKYLYDEETDDAFTEELILTKILSNRKESSRKQLNCLIFFDQQYQKSFFASSPTLYSKAKIFKHIGQIPNKFGTQLKINYNPTTYKIINKLLNGKDNSSKLSSSSYQNTYYQLVKFLQQEENQSQSNILLGTKSRNNKWLISERFQAYQKKCLQQLGFNNKQQSTLEGYYSKINRKVIQNIINNEVISVNICEYKNAIEDLKIYNPKNYLLVRDAIIKYIYFSDKIQNNGQFPYQNRYTSHLIPIFERLIEIFQRKFTQNIRSSMLNRLHNHANGTQIFLYFSFISLLYPYANYNKFTSDLYILRWLVQKKLSFYNDYLNRNHIGLQNFIAPYLLTLFTSLSSELTYRIWDYLIASDQRDKARIIIAFTLLSYFQTTQNLPIIPIDQFMQSVQRNMKTISVEKQFASKFAQVADRYFIGQTNKLKRLQKVLSNSKQASIIQDRYLHKIILGEPKMKIPHEDQGRIPYSKTNHIAKQNDITLKQLSYPLPQPNYNGYPILSMIIFIHDLKILENINLNTNKYWMKFYITRNTNQEPLWAQYIPILQKNFYYNKHISISGQHINIPNISLKYKGKAQEHQRNIKISIISKQKQTQKHLMNGQLNYGLFYKDRAYKTHVCLVPTTLHNKGATILNLSFCLKSVKYDKKNQQLNHEPLQILSQKLLDYDIGQANQSITALKKLKDHFEKIKNPMDEFYQNQYKRIINKSLNFNQAQWIESSSTSIEELKAIFYIIFHQQKDKFIKHEFSKYYEIFAEEYHLQQVYLVQILVKMIILANISRKKKLTYLYCIAVHYQNTYSKTINAQTLNSLLKLIYKQYSHINACPYISSTCGKIIQAYYFESSVKSLQLKVDFTQIFQDLAYICQFKFGYGDIILGTAKDLSILRTLFDLKTLKKLAQQKQCRFEIIYEISGFKYLWSAVIDPKTFEILKRGTKFLNNFVHYSQIKYLDSTQQFLLNGENIIPLQLHESFNYEQFTSIMNNNSILRYLLDLKIINKDLYKKQFTTINLSEKFKDQRQEQRLKEQNEFKNWAIFRGQNCLQSWQKCRIQSDGQVMCKISYEYNKTSCNINKVDLLSMQEINVDQNNK